MNKLVGDRDWSSQEVCHLLLDLPLKHSTRRVLNVNLRRPEEHAQLFFAPDGAEDDNVQQPGQPQKGKTLIQKYQDRADELENVRYVDFCRKYTHDKNPRLRPRAKDRVLNIYPRYKVATEYEDFSRARLMLHHPWRILNDLLYDDVDEEEKVTFAEVYGNCHLFHNHDKDGLDDDEETFNFEDASQDGENAHVQAQDIEASFAELAARLPDASGAHVEDADNLGRRDIDDVDWHPRIGHEGIVDNPDFWKDAKQDSTDEYDLNVLGKKDDLEAKQRVVWNVIINHFWEGEMSILEPSKYEAQPQLLLHIDGQGGTGKTFTVGIVSRDLFRVAKQYGFKKEVLRRVAPTGVAAYNINGRTLHSLFRLPIKTKTYYALTAENLRALQNNLRGVSYLIIDEKSMVSLRVLSFLDRRLREIFPTHAKDPFGGMNIVLMGDFYQLHPVGEMPLYSTARSKTKDQEITRGQALYKRFDKTITLNVVKRQEGDDPRAVAFRQCLDHLRVDAVTHEDWQLISTCVQSQVQNLADFDDAIRIFGKRENVRLYNHSKLRDLQVPVINVTTDHTGHPMAKKASTDEAGNLQVSFALAINAKVMLLENLRTTHGLVNGRMGYVRDVVWGRHVTNPRKESPDVILIYFPSYNGPCFKEVNGEKLVPIFRSRRNFSHGSQACTRTQFPLILAYAITVHKSQGISLDQAVLNITDKEFAPGLTYVAVSCVRTLDGLLFEEPFDFSRFKPRKSTTKQMRHEDTPAGRVASSTGQRRRVT
jgi:ATP-dependent DNA helicase PIF1